MEKKNVTLVDKLERTEEALTNAIVEEYHRLQDALGDRPMWGKRRGPVERLQYYDTIKNDPEEWDRIIQKSGPGEALKFALEMERLRVKQQVPVEEPPI